MVPNKFQQTNLNDDLGQPLWEEDKQGNRIPVPLELVPGGANADNPSYLLYLYDPLNPADARPLDTLGKRELEEFRQGRRTKPRMAVSGNASPSPPSCLNGDSRSPRPIP